MTQQTLRYRTMVNRITICILRSICQPITRSCWQTVSVIGHSVPILIARDITKDLKPNTVTRWAKARPNSNQRKDSSQVLMDQGRLLKMRKSWKPSQAFTTQSRNQIRWLTLGRCLIWILKKLRVTILRELFLLKPFSLKSYEKVDSCDYRRKCR